MPDVFRQAGVELHEVGTTNRTRLADYADAIGPETAALLRVHPSNYRISGFCEAVTIAELAKLGKAHQLPVIDDVGSGCLYDLSRFGLPDEPVVSESLRAGADLVLFSGDKLLGGPQCGIIVGRAEIVAKLRSNPLARALRVDKLTLAALQATLEIHRAGRAFDEIPVLRQLSLAADEIRTRAEQLVERLRTHFASSDAYFRRAGFLGPRRRRAARNCRSPVGRLRSRVKVPIMPRDNCEWASRPCSAACRMVASLIDLRTVDPER